MMYAIYKATKRHYDITGNLYASYACASDDWRIVMGDDEGWIEWYGGECPLPDDVGVDYQHKYGQGFSCCPSCIDWKNVTHYRPRPIIDTKPEPPAWDGEGRPPVGCECEWSDSGRPHKRVLVMGHYGESIWLRCVDDQTPLTVHYVAESYRPIRSEEDMAVEAMKIAMENFPYDDTKQHLSELVYAAIRDDKIPGVKLAGAD